NNGLSVTPRYPSTGLFVLPTKIAPAFSTLSANTQCISAILSFIAGIPPNVVGHPGLKSNKSFKADGIPCRSEERRVGNGRRSKRDWSSDVCSSDLIMDYLSHRDIQAQDYSSYQLKLLLLFPPFPQIHNAYPQYCLSLQEYHQM